MAITSNPTAFLTPLPGEQILLKISLDGGSTYAHPCIINLARGFTVTAATVSEKIPDCANPGNPSQVVRLTESIDVKLDGQGTLDSNTAPAYTSLALSGNIVPIKASLNYSNANSNSSVLTGNFILTSFVITGTPHSLTTANLTFEQAAPVVYTST